MTNPDTHNCAPAHETRDPRVPTFLFIGGQRCGSSWIHNCLEEHPQVFTAEPKELHYFDRNHDKGPEWYLGHFAPAPDQKAWGEVTPDYISDEHAPARAAALCPNAKLIAVLRDPIDRAHSIYLLKRNTSLNYPTFEEALEHAPEVIDHGKYDEHIDRWRSHFDESQLLVLLYDDLLRDDRAVIERIYDFIGVDPSYQPTWLGRTYNAGIMPRVRNKLRAVGLDPIVKMIGATRLGDLIRRVHRRVKSRRGSAAPIKRKTRARLSTIYKPHNERLASRTGLDVSAWG